MLKKEIEKHRTAASALIRIKNRAFEFIRKNIGNISEYDVQRFIIKELKKDGLKTNFKEIIVASNRNTSFMHYFPKKNKSRKIKKNDLIMVDIWAGLNNKDNKKSPFADITWMAYAGKRITKRIETIFNKVTLARDKALKFIIYKLNRKIIPTGKEIDEVARNSFGKLKNKFIHSAGHSLGKKDCHGKDFNLSPKNNKKIKRMIPFTIEPGLYFRGKFGVRSEIDCYITKNYKLIITTPVQKKIELLI